MTKYKVKSDYIALKNLVRMLLTLIQILNSVSELTKMLQKNIQRIVGY